MDGPGQSWASLPTEALLFVYLRLDVQSVCAASLVCQQWRSIADSPSLWRHFLRDERAVLPDSAAGLGDDLGIRAQFIRVKTSRLHTWGEKTLNLEASPFRRLTAPHPVCARALRLGAAALDTARPDHLAAVGGECSALRAVSCGEDFSAVLTWDGRVVDTRFLADVDRTPWRPPAQTVVAVAAGGARKGSKGGHVLALTSCSEVWAWGDNSRGQLGIGFAQGFVSAPKAVLNTLREDRIIGVDCGKYHSAAWSQGGQLYSCGDNSCGACGLGKEMDQVPLFLEVDVCGVCVASVSAGANNTIACSQEGRVFVCGDNRFGQCGKMASKASDIFKFLPNGPDASWPGMPRSGQNVKGGGGDATQKVVAVAAGSVTLYAVTDNGDMYSWGQGGRGELGTGGMSKLLSTPTRAPWANRIRSVMASSGGRFAAALDQNGRLYSWGEGKFGQLGHGDTSKKTTGRVVKALQGCEVVDIACGADFMMAITAWKSSLRSGGRTVTLTRPIEVPSLPTSEKFDHEAPEGSSPEGHFRYIDADPCSLGSSPDILNPSMDRRCRRRFRWHHSRTLPSAPLSTELVADVFDSGQSDIEIPSCSSPDVGNRQSARHPDGACTTSTCNWVVGDDIHCGSPSTSNCSSSAVPIPQRRGGGFAAHRPAQSSARDVKCSPGGIWGLPCSIEELTREQFDPSQKGQQRYHAMLRRALKAFANDPSRRELYFSPTLTSNDRRKMHIMAQGLGLGHESVGQEPSRQLVIRKPSQRGNWRARPFHDIGASDVRVFARTV